MGAAAQCLLAACLPLRYALLPAPALLLCRLVKTLLMTAGLVPHDLAGDVIHGKYTAQVPGPNGAMPASPSQNGVCLLMLGARSSHPLGTFSPGLRKVGDYLEKMRASLEDGNKNGSNGFLCQTTFLSANERYTGSQLMMLCYFRSADDAHAFAHGPLHREAWAWWFDITKKYPHLSIRHELYDVPAGHWENVYVNSHPAGLAGMNALVRCNGGWTRPLFDASKMNLRTTMGRLGHTDGTDNEKYGPEPY
ncbi:hypothetical protein PG994_002807 [Apiospora phragmitis]|uniref:Monooxygenase n=1 Tax=Apiospora phragmitis TaxID=2905665 RepID=A0ABR1W672_9PEZI